MADCVLNQRLNRQRWQEEIGILDIIFDGKILPKAHLLDGQVDSGVLQLLCEGDQMVISEAVQVRPQIIGKVVCDVPGFHWILDAQEADGRQGVVKKMGLYLREHDLGAFFCQLRVDFRHLGILPGQLRSLLHQLEIFSSSRVSCSALHRTCSFS